MSRSFPLTYKGKLRLKQPLSLVSFISHPTKSERLLAITSTAVLEITLEGNCIAISGSSSASTDWCNSDDITHDNHDSFGQLTQIYLPGSRLREEMALGVDEVLLVDKLNYCIHRLSLSDRVMQSFIGVCGNGDVVTAYEERQLDNLTLHSPVSVSYLIVQSVGHLMIESEQSDLYIVSIQSSVAYRQPALSHNNGFVGSGRIIYSSETRLLSILISADASENNRKCYVRQSNENSTSIEDVDCNLSTINLKDCGFIVLTDYQLYKYKPDINGFTAGLQRVDLVFDSVTHITRGINSQLIAYSEIEQQFLVMDGEDEAQVHQKKTAFLRYDRPSSTYRTQDMMSTRHTSAESCAYASTRSVMSAGFKYFSATKTCVLIKDMEKVETIVVPSPVESADMYLNRPLIGE